MNRFVSLPNLPILVKKLVIGEKYAKILQNGLKKYNIGIVALPDNPYVDPRLSSHADLSVLHMGGEQILLAKHLKNTSFASEILELGFSAYYPEIVQDTKYPNDTQLNLCIIGKKVISGRNAVSSALVKYFTNIDKTNLIYVKQGYARCSTCVIGENAIITSDKGIYQAVKRYGIDALLISSGYIDLEGFDYGFIGGAAFKISNNTIAFTGHLNKHPDREIIIAFLESHGVYPIYITNRAIFDIGSAIPIIEQS